LVDGLSIHRVGAVTTMTAQVASCSPIEGIMIPDSGAIKS
jgi:hypothetical protein